MHFIKKVRPGFNHRDELHTKNYTYSFSRSMLGDIIGVNRCSHPHKNKPLHSINAAIYGILCRFHFLFNLIKKILLSTQLQVLPHTYVRHQ